MKTPFQIPQTLFAKVCGDFLSLPVGKIPKKMGEIYEKFRKGGEGIDFCLT